MLKKYVEDYLRMMYIKLRLITPVYLLKTEEFCCTCGASELLHKYEQAPATV